MKNELRGLAPAGLVSASMLAAIDVDSSPFAPVGLQG